MAQLQAILTYQDLDAKLYKLERELAGCDERKEYQKVKKFLETAPEKLDALDAKAVSLKAEAAEIAQKYARVEETLKEFENLDELITGGADIAFYKKKLQSIVDQLKKLKADLNGLTEAINATDSEFQKMKKQVISAQKQYPEVSEKYKAVKAANEAQRKELEVGLAPLVKEIPEKMLEVYQTKRKERIFPIIGELTGNRCPFCSMEPPLAARNKLTGGGMIERDNCHRIIFGK